MSRSTSSTNITYQVTRDLSALIDDLSPKEMKKAWRATFRQAANRVRRAAIAEASTVFSQNGTALAREGIKGIIYSNGKGFSVVTSPGKKAKTAHINRWNRKKAERGDTKIRAVPVVMWADTGVKRDNHKGWKSDRPAAHFMAAVEKSELPPALAAVGAAVEKQMAKAIAKRIKAQYGPK